MNLKSFNVSVFYDAQYYPKYDEMLEDTIGKGSDGSGMGFGERDLSWSFRSEKAGRNAFDKLCKLRVPGLQLRRFAIEK